MIRRSASRLADNLYYLEGRDGEGPDEVFREMWGLMTAGGTFFVASVLHNIWHSPGMPPRFLAILAKHRNEKTKPKKKTKGKS